MPKTPGTTRHYIYAEADANLDALRLSLEQSGYAYVVQPSAGEEEQLILVSEPEGTSENGEGGSQAEALEALADRLGLTYDGYETELDSADSD